MKTNYHTHTYRCNHAKGNEEDYVRAALENGYDVLGFADHTPWPYKTPGFIPRIRMRMDEWQDYLNCVQKVKEKYAGQIEIHCGVEAEYFPEYMDWLKEQLDCGIIEYAIFGNHYAYPEEIQPAPKYFGNCAHTMEGLEIYLKQMIGGMESGLFRYIAHPDLFFRQDGSFDENCRMISRRICEKAKECGCILELNVSGYSYAEKHGHPGYPHPEFWKIAAEVGNKVIIGMDAHHPDALRSDRFRLQGEALAKELKLDLIECFEI